MCPTWSSLGAELGNRIEGMVLVKVPMARFTTWRIGGPADLVAIPRSEADVRQCLGWAKEHDLPVQVIGNGSNLLVQDGGIRGLVIKTARGLNTLQVNGGALRLGAGVLLPSVLRLAARHGWRGLEFAAGIPGTVGGAVLMNAGTREATIGELVRRVGLIDRQGEYLELEAKDITFGYRSSSLRDIGALVSNVTLEVKPGEPGVVVAAIKKRIADRKRTQPYRWPSAGSVFKNPPGGPPAGWLIEQVGGKGLRCGEAMVAQEHANFIINTGGAKAEDVMCLMEEVKRRVLESFGVELEKEICILGEARG